MAQKYSEEGSDMEDEERTIKKVDSQGKARKGRPGYEPIETETDFNKFEVVKGRKVKK